MNRLRIVSDGGDASATIDGQLVDCVRSIRWEVSGGEAPRTVLVLDGVSLELESDVELIAFSPDPSGVPLDVVALLEHVTRGRWVGAEAPEDWPLPEVQEPPC